MTTPQRRRPAGTEGLRGVFHLSFLEAGAEAAYGPGTDPATAAGPATHLADDHTRDFARRMHYAAYRAGEAGRDAAAWRSRYHALRDRIILGNRKLVYRVVQRYPVAGLGPDDLIGECHLVMIRAVAAYNPWIGVRFSTYLCTCLIRAVARLGKRRSADRLRRALDLDAVADTAAAACPAPAAWDPVGAHLRDDDPLLSRREKLVLERRFGLSGGRGALTLAAVGQALGLSKERVRQLQASALGKLRQVVLAATPA